MYGQLYLNIDDFLDCLTIFDAKIISAVAIWSGARTERVQSGDVTTVGTHLVKNLNISELKDISKKSCQGYKFCTPEKVCAKIHDDEMSFSYDVKG